MRSVGTGGVALGRSVERPDELLATPDRITNSAATKVTSYYPSGTLTGTGKATQILHPDGTTTVENGTVALTKGTGKLKGRKLNAKFAGPFKDGVYTFTYSGTLK